MTLGRLSDIQRLAWLRLARTETVGPVAFDHLLTRYGTPERALSILSVIIFTGLTAYDTQKIKAMNVIGNAGTDEDTKEAISGALTLYLDFINLFLSLLRLTGRRRD